MDSQYPVYDIWMSHDNSDNTDNNVGMMQSEGHNFILVQRESWQPQPLLIEESLYLLLMAIQQNTPLIELTDLLDNSPMDIASLIQQGFVTGFDFDINDI